MLVELRRVEPGQANIGIVGELAKNDPAAEVVHVAPNEVQAAAELIGQREHEGYVVRKPRVRWRVRTAATERQAGQAAVIKVHFSLNGLVDIDGEELGSAIERVELPVERHGSPIGLDQHFLREERRSYVAIAPLPSVVVEIGREPFVETRRDLAHVDLGLVRHQYVHIVAVIGLEHEAPRQLAPIDLIRRPANLIELGEVLSAGPLGDVVARPQLVGDARQYRSAIVQNLIGAFLVEGGRVFQIGHTPGHTLIVPRHDLSIIKSLYNREPRDAASHPSRCEPAYFTKQIKHAHHLETIIGEDVQRLIQSYRGSHGRVEAACVVHSNETQNALPSPRDSGIDAAGLSSPRTTGAMAAFGTSPKWPPVASEGRLRLQSRPG